eukprot:scaffold143198_cov148-Phaeocystis_antarctica.AAC.1
MGGTTTTRGGATTPTGGATTTKMGGATTTIGARRRPRPRRLRPRAASEATFARARVRALLICDIETGLRTHYVK